LAKCLKVNLQNCFSPDLGEGDGKLFDQSVFETFINLYWSTMLVHLDPNMTDFPIFEKVCKFLLRNMLHRVTKIFADIWVTIRDGVPSGAYNTSHMDSFVMLMYFCLFSVFQIHNAPEQDREALELEFLEIVAIIVYGDDFLYRKGLGLASVYLSVHAFAAFMYKYFNVRIRDIKDGIPFCSKVKDGWIVTPGATFLKHQFIINPNTGPGQAIFLPFRESREFLIRAIWGRIPRFRDVIDTMLSVIGHAYGTYASNMDAYNRLKILYSELLMSIGDIENLPDRMMARMTPDDIKKIRQVGLTPEELVSGFPSYSTLVEKNVVDKSYQDTTVLPMDFTDILGGGDLF